jgi:hypothetical protein
VPLREGDFAKDPLFKSIYEIKHKSIMQLRAKSKKNMLKLEMIE